MPLYLVEFVTLTRHGELAQACGEGILMEILAPSLMRNSFEANIFWTTVEI
jgi:hypothetical protein